MSASDWVAVRCLHQCTSILDREGGESMAQATTLYGTVFRCFGMLLIHMLGKPFLYTLSH